MNKYTLYNKLTSIIAIISFYLTIWTKNKSPTMPSIIKIMEAAIRILNNEQFYQNALYTMKIVLIGISISFTVGTILAIFCSANSIIHSAVMPIINATKNIPSIALFPIFIVLMGIGDLPRIFVIIWNSAYPIISSTLSGISEVDKEVIEAAQNAGTNNIQMYIYIKLLKILFAAGYATRKRVRIRIW